MTTNLVTITDIANTPGAREEFQEAWRVDKSGIRRVAMEALKRDGLLVITDHGDGEAELRFTNTEDPGVKMVIALMKEDAEPMHLQ